MKPAPTIWWVILGLFALVYALSAYLMLTSCDMNQPTSTAYGGCPKE